MCQPRYKSGNKPVGVPVAGVAVPGEVADGVGGGAEAVTPVEPTAVPVDSKQFGPRPLSETHHPLFKAQMCFLQVKKVHSDHQEFNLTSHGKDTNS